MIDPEILRFVIETERFYPSDAASRSVAEQRQLYEAYARAFGTARPACVTAEDQALAVESRKIALRRCRRTGAASRGTVVYAHGGGFIVGSLDSHDGIVARIAERTGADVVAVDYRLAPEHTGPAALDDVLAAIEAVARRKAPWPALAPQPLVLCGDSAGASLVTSAALRLAQSGIQLAGLALIYPMLGREPAAPACHTEADAPMLTLADVRYYRDTYLAGAAPDPWTFPLEAPSLAGLPPTFLLAAEHDPLRDDSTEFAGRLRQAGGTADLRVGPGLVHGFLRALDRSPVAAKHFDELLGFIGQRLGAS